MQQKINSIKTGINPERLAILLRQIAIGKNCEFILPCCSI